MAPEEGGEGPPHPKDIVIYQNHNSSIHIRKQVIVFHILIGINGITLSEFGKVHSRFRVGKEIGVDLGVLGIPKY